MKNLGWKESARDSYSTRKKRATTRRQMILHRIRRSSTTSRQHYCVESDTRRVVRFSDDLEAVVHIPSVTDYSLESRQNMWGTREEKKRSVLRNQLEFAFEGFDFEKVLEEDQFVSKEHNRHAVHPVHSMKKRRSEVFLLFG